MRIVDTARWVSSAARRSSLLLLALLSACEDAPTGPGELSLSCTATAVTADGAEIPVAPGGFATVRNQIVRAGDCQPFRFAGVGRPALSFSPDGGRLGAEATAADDFTNIRSWGANTVRIELAQYYWVPTSRHYDAGYRARVERAVRLAREAGLNVILALQYSDRGIADYPGNPGLQNMHQPMPDVNHSVPFWRDLATRYKDDGGVLFELYSEPYPVGGENGFSNWDLWRNGGMAPADRTYDELRPAFQAVGMQQLYDVVRATGADNLVIISGTTWGYHLNGVPTNRVRGHNIAYATHPWDWPDKRPESWERDWAFLAQTDPVIITEFGNYDCTPGYVREVLDTADRLNVSWIAWAWHAPNPGQSLAQTGRDDVICRFPMLISDWSGTPSRTGEIVRARLQSYRAGT